MAYAQDYDLIGVGAVGGSASPRSLERSAVGNRILDMNRFDDVDETDIEFINKLYRGDHPDYFLGGWIIKSVTDVFLHYMGMPKPEAKHDEQLDKYLNDTYDANRTKLYRLFKYVGLYGQGILELGYNTVRKVVTLNPATSSKVIEVRRENYNDPNEVTYIRLRTTSERFVKKTTGDGTGEPEYERIPVYFDKIYWKTNNADYVEAVKNNDAEKIEELDEFNYHVKVLKIEGEKVEVHIPEKINPWNCIPVVIFNQNMLEGDTNGYSDANGLIRLAGVYHQILERTIDANMYNGQPTIVFSGLDDPKSFVNDMYGMYDGSGVYTEGIYNTFGGYYLKGGSSVEYLQVNDTVSNAKTLLELLFYIFIQVSGVPEWALGANLNSTYASAKMQSSPLTQRINSKRFDIHDSLLETNEKIALIHESYDNADYDDKNTSVGWDEVIPDEDMDIQTRITMAREAGLLTDETFMKLLRVAKDYTNEIKEAKKQTSNKIMSSEESQAIVQNMAQKLGVQLPNVDGEDGVDVGGEMTADAFTVALTELVKELSN